MKIVQPLKWHGGKAYLAPKLWELAKPILPKVVLAVETHCGGATWALEGMASKIPVSFVLNDIHLELTNFWSVLQCHRLFQLFRRHVEAVPFSQVEWADAGNPLEQENTYETYGGVDVVRAVKFFVRCRQSRAGQMKDFATATKTRLRRGMNEQVSAWLTCVDGLPIVHRLLRQASIMNESAPSVIKKLDGPNTLYYVDPPYPTETRTAKKVYEHEMTEDQHKELLGTLIVAQGKVMISSYRNALYDDVLSCLKRHDFELPNNAAGGKTKRRMTESVWTNF